MIQFWIKTNWKWVLLYRLVILASIWLTGNRNQFKRIGWLSLFLYSMMLSEMGSNQLRVSLVLLAHYPCFVTSCPRCDDSSFVGLRSLATCSWCTAMPCSKRMNLWNSIRIIFFQFLPRHYMVALVEKLESWKNRWNLDCWTNVSSLDGASRSDHNQSLHNGR